MMNRIIVNIDYYRFEIFRIFNWFSFEGMFKEASCSFVSLIKCLGICVEKMGKLVGRDGFKLEAAAGV